MRIATWNVNSLRVRLPQVLEWLGRVPIDVLAMQETKLTDADFPRAELAALGYQVLASGQKAYNGVALLSRWSFDEVRTAIPSFTDDARRVLAALTAGVRVVNLYVPNGQTVDSDKYRYKLRWLAAVRDWRARSSSGIGVCSCSVTSTSPPRTGTCTTRRPGWVRCT